MKRAALLLLVPLYAGCLGRSPYEPRFDVFVELNQQQEKIDSLAMSEEWIWWAAQGNLFRVEKKGGLIASMDQAGGDAPPLLVDDDQAFYVRRRGEGGVLYALTWDGTSTLVTAGVLSTGENSSGPGSGAYAVTEDEEYLYYVASSCGGGCEDPVACPGECPPDSVCVCSWSKTTGVHALLTQGHPDWKTDSSVQIVRSESALFFNHTTGDGFQLSTRQIEAIGPAWEDAAVELVADPIKFILGRASGGVYGAFEPESNDNPGAGGIHQFRAPDPADSSDRGAWEEIAETRGGVLSMVLGPQHLYWIAENEKEGGQYELSRVSLEGRDSEFFGTFGRRQDDLDWVNWMVNHQRVVADEHHVYWNIEDHGQILRLPVDPP